MVLPLEGIRVLDFSQAIMTPLAAMMLGDMGAEVIKIERVEGEALRWGRPAGMDKEFGMQAGAESSGWMGYNRSKKSLAIDITHERGREVVLRLAKDTDVFLHNWRPGVSDRLQLTYKAVSNINPKIIYCWVTGFGETGPLAHRIGGDLYTQALTGVVDMQGNPQGSPYLLPFAMGDYAGGIMISYAIMLALFVRERTGIGQEIGINQVDTEMYLQLSQLSEYLIDGTRHSKEGRCPVEFTPPWGAYPAKDGDVVTMFGADPTWPAFCKVLGIEHLAHDPRFDTDEKRREHLKEMYTYLDQAFRKKTREEWREAFREAKMRCDPCLTHEEFLAHEQVQANEMIMTLEHPVRGPIKMLGIPVKLKATPGRPQGPPPLLGEHTEEILVKLGYTAKEIDELAEIGVVRIAKKA